MSSLVCKKCGGNHLTIKCGKNKNKSNDKNNSNDKNKSKNKKYSKDKNKSNNGKSTKEKSNKKFTIRISNLPNDITVKELNELILPWGHIGNINFGKSTYIAAYVDFFNKDEAEYFVKALDRTPFDNLLMSVQLLDN